MLSVSQCWNKLCSNGAVTASNLCELKKRKSYRGWPEPGLARVDVEQWQLDDEIPCRRSGLCLETRVGDVIVAERLIKAVRDLDSVQSLNGSRTNAIRFVMVADLVQHHSWNIWSFPFFTWRLQSVFFTPTFVNKAFFSLPTAHRVTYDFALRTPDFQPHLLLALYKTLHIPSIQWLIRLLQQTKKAKHEQNLPWTSHHADLNCSKRHLRLLHTLQQQPNQQLHIYRPTLQQQQHWTQSQENLLSQSTHRPFRPLLQPAQSSAPWDPHQETWVLPEPSARYVGS